MVGKETNDSSSNNARFQGTGTSCEGPYGSSQKATSYVWLFMYYSLGGVLTGNRIDCKFFHLSAAKQNGNEVIVASDGRLLRSLLCEKRREEPHRRVNECDLCEQEKCIKQVHSLKRWFRGLGGEGGFDAILDRSYVL